MMKKKREGMTQTTAQQCQTRCEKNPTCCSKRNALCFAKPFKPPLIGPQKDFCNQAVGRGIPVPNCELGKPVTFIYPRSVFYGLEPADKPGSSPQLKNWKKWCTVWNSNQTALRDKETPPSIMTCGEGWRRKLEDQELVDRTVHSHHMYGFNIPNTLYPNPIAPGKECLDIQETLTRRLFRDYPPMEKLRVPKTIRDEMHLPQRHPPREGKGDSAGAGQYWKWDKNWSNSKYLQETKSELREDIAKHGPIQPCPNKLIVQGKSMPGGQKGKRKTKLEDLALGLAYPIPQIIFSQESDGPLYQSTTVAQDPEFRIPLYEEKRGPVLYIEGRTFQVLLKKQVHAPTEAPLRENQFLYDVMDGFAATTKCKEVRHICLKNQGTTAVRFQWLRAPPSTAIRNLLGNPGKMLHLNEMKSIGAGESRPTNLLESCELSRYRVCGGRKQKKNVSVHLTTSAKVDPALTRTLKIMRNCATSGLAFENLLLMLALRVPRLKRLLIRRTGRQLKRRQLPLHVQQLYLKLKQKQRVERKLKEESENLPEEPEIRAKETAISFFDEVLGESQESAPEEDENVDQNKSPGLCPCQTMNHSSAASSVLNAAEHSGDMSESSVQFIQSKPKHARKPRICECSDPIPKKHKCGGDHLTGDAVTERGQDLTHQKCFPRTPPSTSRTEFLEYEEQGEFQYCQPKEIQPSSDFFECVGEWEEILGEINCGEGGERNEIPVGATPDFYPLGYGKSIVRHNRKCRGNLVPKTEYIAPPKHDLVTWMNGQRVSINEGPNPLQSTSSEESSDPNGEIFKELKGYDVRRDYDSDDQRVTIEVGLESKDSHRGEATGESEERESPHQIPVIPLRPTPKTHQLNTQTVSQNEFNLQSVTSPIKSTSQEFEDVPEVEVVEVERHNNPSDKISTLEEPEARHNSSHSSGERSPRKTIPLPKDKVLEFLKDPCSDFHFRELPGVLLPGQTTKFPIIFRPRKPGFHYETLYLVTHPRLCEATYAVRLNGICIDPDLPTKTGPTTKTSAIKGRKEDSAIWKTSVDKVESEMKEEMLKKQGRDLFDAIIDNVFYMSEIQKSTLPFGKVTTESIFYAHNPALFYHHGIAEKALKTVRKLVSRVVPKERLVDNNICSLNIEVRNFIGKPFLERIPRDTGIPLSQSGFLKGYLVDLIPVTLQNLYQELSRPNSNYLWSNFKTQETEDLLSDFTHCTQILTKPNAMNAISLGDQKFNASYYFLLTIINEISFELIGIEQSYQTPELVEVVRASITDRFQRKEARESKKRQREEMKKAALVADSEKVAEGGEDETDVQTNTVDKVDVGTQKDLNDPPEIVPPTERKTSRGKESSKPGRPGKKGKNKNKAGKEEKAKSKEIETLPVIRTPSPQDDPDAITDQDTDQIEGGENFGKSSSNQDGTFPMGNKSSRASQTEERPGSSELEKREVEEFNRLQQLRQYQAKRVVFENILSVGIERMMCVIDNMNNMNQYKPSEYITPEPDSHLYCC